MVQCCGLVVGAGWTGVWWCGEWHVRGDGIVCLYFVEVVWWLMQDMHHKQQRPQCGSGVGGWVLLFG